MKAKYSINILRISKMKKYSFYSIITLFIFSVNFIYAGDNPWEESTQTKAGIAGFTFLKIPPTARIAAMGNAFMATSDDINAIFVNPAGITEAGDYAFHLSNTKWLVNSNFYAGAFSMYLGGNSYIGISVIGLVPEPTLERSTASADPNGLTGKYISMYDYAIGLTYAAKIFNRLSLGIKVNYVNETIMNLSASNLVFDIGSLFYTNFKTIRIGMGLRNFGSDTQYPDRILFHMPIVYTIGVAGEVYGLDKDSPIRVTLTGEATFQTDYDQRYQLGTEIWFMKIIALRGGYMFNAGTDDPWHRFDYKGNQFALGFGGKINAGGVKLTLDFSYTKSDRLFKDPIRFSFGGSF